MGERMLGKVEAVLIGDNESGISREAKKIQVFANRGIKGDVHFGNTRLTDVRERELKRRGLEKGIEIANFRQFSATSAEELKLISQMVGIPEDLPYGLLGENLVVSGIEGFTQMPSGTMFLFKKDEKTIRTAALVAWRENTPCEIPAGNIQQHYIDLKFAMPFQTAAIGKRGIVGMVYSSGFIHQGDVVEAFVLPTGNR